MRFPATREDIADAVRRRVIPLGDGRTVPVSTIVRKTTRAEYGSAREVVAEANALWDDVDRAGHGD